MHTAGSLALFFQLPPYVLWPYAAGAAVALIAVFATRQAATQARAWDKLLALTPLAAFGAEHLTIARFISTMVPSFIPWHMFWAYFVGCALITAALSIASNVQMRLACTLLGLMFFVFVATMHIPGIVADPKNLLTWALALRDFSFGAGAWALAGSLNKQVRSPSAVVMITVGRFVIATAVLYFAVLHFLHPAVLPGVPDAKLTPVWMPGRFVLAYATGAVLAVAGVFILLGTRARMAATYLGAWILLLVALIYVPMAIAIPSSAAGDVKLEGLNYFFDTMLFAGTALALARGMAARAREG